MYHVKQHPDLELQLVVSASALLYRFGNVIEIIRRDGFEPNATVYLVVEGENPTTMAKSTGLAIVELATIFGNLQPDLVLTVADRYETIATAIAASYMNIPVAHTQGGEVTGSIDESVRHAVTKLSHLHFPATRQSAQNLIRMGEDPDTVFFTGCPSLDIVAALDLTLSEDVLQRYGGTGNRLDISKPYLVVLQHPVTTEYGQGFHQVNETLKAIMSVGMQAIWLWPNVDAGSDDVSKGLRMFRERHQPNNLMFYRNFAVEDYARLINSAACIVGNSSSAIREGAFLGVPAVNIGSRQQGREHGPNVLHADYEASSIQTAIHKQVVHGKYQPSALFGDGTAGKQITEILASADIQIQKRLAY